MTEDETVQRELLGLAEPAVGCVPASTRLTLQVLLVGALASSVESQWRILEVLIEQAVGI